MKNKKILSIFLALISVFSVLMVMTIKISGTNTSYESFYSQFFDVSKSDNYETLLIDKQESDENLLDKLTKLKFQNKNSDDVSLYDEKNEEVVFNDINLLSRNKAQFFENNDFSFKETENNYVIYPKYQLKRLIVNGKVKNNFGAKKVISGYKDYNILCYETEEATKTAYLNLKNNKSLDVFVDKMVISESYAENDYDYSNNKSWGAKAIDYAGYLDYLKTNNFTNNEIVVAVIDTGINTAHEMFENRLMVDEYDYKIGYSFYSSAYTYSGYSYEDDNGHGTHVSGIIADITPENVKILPVKSLASNGKGSMSNVIAGVSYVDSVASKYNIACVNMSLGLDSLDGESVSLFENLFAGLREKGILTAVAAGNEATNTSNNLPACIDSAIVVSAVKQGQDFAYEFDSEYSNYGSTVDVSAPGTNIYSAYIGTTSMVNSSVYRYLDGTSMATPFVSGAISLIYLEKNNTFSKNSSLSDAVEKTLKENVMDLGENGYDEYYGYGMLNLKYFQVEKNNASLKFKNSETGEEFCQKDGFTEFNSNFNLEVSCNDSFYKVFYTTDGSIPTKNSKEYLKPIEITDTKSFSFIALKFDSSGNVVGCSDVYFIGLFNANMSVWNYVKITQFSSGKVYVIGYTGHYTHLTIPSHFQDIEIVGIRAGVFENNKELESITLSNSITEIAKNAFSVCKNLKYVYAPMVETIGERAFYSCKNLETIFAPKVKNVGGYSFYGTNLSYLYSNLDDFEIDEKSSNQNANETKIKGGYFEVLNDAGIYSFANCPNLKGVKLDNLEILQECAFADCLNLESCIVSNAKTINNFAFDYCSNLKEFSIGKDVSMIGSTVFRGTSLTYFDLHSENKNFYTDGNGLYGKNRFIAFVSDKTIGLDYEILSSVKIRGIDTIITSIDDYAFDGAIIKELTIFEDIVTIGKGCFYDSRIDIVEFNAKNLSSLKYISTGTVYSIFEKAKIKIFNINNSVESLPSSLFRNAEITKMNINKYDIDFNASAFTKSNIETVYFNFDEQVDLTYITNKTKTAILAGAKNLYLKSKLNGDANINYNGKKFYLSQENKNGYYHYSTSQTAKFDIFYTVTNFKTTYDGTYHNISVKVDGLTNYQITYGLSESEYNITNINSNNKFKNSTNGKMTVYFKISADGWEDTYGFGYLTINKIDLTVAISNGNGIYGDNPNLVGTDYSVTAGSLILGETIELDYFTDATKQSNIGLYSLKAKPKASVINYNINFIFGTYEIVKRNLTLKFDDITKTYGDVDLKGNEYEIISGSVENNDNLNLVINYGTNDFYYGTYTVDLESYNNLNYNITTISGTLKIEKRKVSIKISSGNTTFGDEITVNENSYVITSGSFVFDDENLINLKVKTLASSSSDVGMYNVTCTYNENVNYILDIEEGKYIISKRKVKLTISDSSSIYGEKVILNDYFVSSGNFMGDDERLCNVMLATDANENSDIGEYKINCTFNKMKNYNVTIAYNGKHTITKRNVTIKLDDAESYYGNTIYLNGYQITDGSFVRNDLESLNLNIYSDVKSLSDFGTYLIEASFANLLNYNVSIINGTYTILKREILVKISDYFGVYGEDIKLENSYEILNGEFCEDDGTKFNLKLSTSATKNSKVGTYDIVGTFDELLNYNIVVENGKYTITKRQIEIKLADQTGTYGENPRYNLDYKIIFGSKVLGDDLMISIFADIDNYSSIGEYVLCGASNNPNYDVVVYSGTYVIEKRKVTIKAVDQKLPHFGKIELDQTKYTAVSGSIVNNDDMGVVLTVKDVNRKSNWGTYEIEITAQNENYEITTENGNLIIEISIYDGLIVGTALFVLIFFICIIHGVKVKRRKRKRMLEKKKKKMEQQVSKNAEPQKKPVSSQSKPKQDNNSSGGSKFI